MRNFISDKKEDIRFVVLMIVGVFMLIIGIFRNEAGWIALGAGAIGLPGYQQAAAKNKEPM